MANYYCKWCGVKHSSVASLTAGPCLRNPVKGAKHELYEGSEKKQYICKYCGIKHSSIASLTSAPCLKNPRKGAKHEPAL
ncbi:hypothetical protein [Treponema primitia]|uniref:hypothetical protein n=1 Tax=Treponema primitia TaxID=88058 RepID=UPI0009DAFDDF|nr:hypothetical protein [Treponema primitia]